MKKHIAAKKNETRRGHAPGPQKIPPVIDDTLSPRETLRVLIRTRIVSAGRKCFQAYGFAATTIENIALEAKIGRTAIYQYFSNKNEIMRQAIEEDEQLFFEAFVATMPSPHNLKTKTRAKEEIRRGVLAMCEIYRSEGAFLRVIREAALSDQSVADLLNTNFEIYVRSIFERTVGAIEPQDVKRLEIRIWIAIMAVDQIFLRFISDGAAFDEEIIVDELTDLWASLVFNVR
ncbi:TetR/AcrR family transcriptional regulator [Novosphingobium colocasiae]|uniref:TetR/AcrR family transcriptional regulator n=1 Tax=Novosphingobium colocasiae TaxID=1256513 RepID=UPI001677EF13|nr:TetR/AcrR family transcriptional regulator [Novosphingobium colocasiae]